MAYVSDNRIETYRLKKGVYFDDRVDDLVEMLEKYFEGTVKKDLTVDVDGQQTTCYILEESSVDGLNRVIAGKVSYPRQKSRLAIRFVETHPMKLDPDADPSEAINAKNEFLYDVTRRTAEDRRSDWKDKVKD